MHNKNLSYRADIDGLRAVAVMLVVLNHVGFSLFSGGFVGVDVFFVISGYLITGIILGQVGKGTFSFTDFYLRRARRILPALYVVLLCVMVAGYYFFLPSDYSALSQSTLSAIFFASNLFFWKNSGGYFSSSSEEMPLLHIWSLSVEEQFYFIWPLALLLILKLKAQSARLAVASVLVVTSFALAELGVRNEWSSAYFLLPSRAGELLIGALLAFWLAKRQPVNRASVIANMLSIVGLLMVLVPAFVLNKTSGFPGINALIPCAGAGLIIVSRAIGKNLISLMLESRPFVFIGLISYSLYLWHWPLISFLHYSRVEITIEIALGVVFASIVLGYLSWRFVEQAFRHNNKPVGKGFAAATALAGLFVVSFPIAVYLKDGIPSRFPFAMLTQDQLTAELNRYWSGIETTSMVAKFDSTKGQRKIVVVGNSHAYDFSYALTENEFNGQLKLIATPHFCFNFSHDYGSLGKIEECKHALKMVLESPELRTADAIYLHDNWDGKNLGGLSDMINKIRSINSAPIYVIGPKMVFLNTAPKISKEAQIERHVTVASINEFSRRFEAPEKFEYDDELKAFFKEKEFKDVQYVSALDVQCGAERKCDILSESGEYLYFDYGHFTLAGSKRFGKSLKEKFSYLF
ncbi:acyltransferase family protein [Pseudomonas sp. GM80]|uniref:acyltransferase family protein n=1 Tax=Pseudomonas sp. GM80 TaxID=1144339 RepID=UPI00026FD0A7|nr:acyltransferase family protein [Pseudomonas sp. GM80]EJN36289.1 putative acyltransferase [Pseudomonas sp. GM80]